MEGKKIRLGDLLNGRIGEERGTNQPTRLMVVVDEPAKQLSPEAREQYFEIFRNRIAAAAGVVALHAKMLDEADKFEDKILEITRSYHEPRPIDAGFLQAPSREPWRKPKVAAEVDLRHRSNRSPGATAPMKRKR